MYFAFRPFLHFCILTVFTFFFHLDCFHFFCVLTIFTFLRFDRFTLLRFDRFQIFPFDFFTFCILAVRHFTKGMDFAYWWSCIGKGLRLGYSLRSRLVYLYKPQVGLYKKTSLNIFFRYWTKFGQIGVGPADKRPFTDWLHQCVPK